MQLVNNRHFKHKFHDSKIVSVVRTSKNSLSSEKNLYIECENDSQIIGMSNQKEFMLSTHLQEKNWQETLEKWAVENLYVSFVPDEYMMDKKEAEEFMSSVIEKTTLNNEYGIGMAVINDLGIETPTPNDEIFNSRDHEKVILWYYENHVKE